MLVVQIADLKPPDREAHKTLLAAMVKSIREHGLLIPITIDKKMRIIDGALRYYAHLELGKTKIEAQIV